MATLWFLLASYHCNRQESPIKPSHIPFARHRPTGLLFDASEIPDGRARDFECPSCGVPVLAQQSEECGWHFAYTTGSPPPDGVVTEGSPFASIRLMAHQLLQELRTFRVPAAPGQTESQHRWLTLDACQSSAHFHGIPVDAVCTVQGVPLVIYLTHPGRQVPSELYEVKGDEVAVLCIGLEVLPRYYDDPRAKRDGEWLNREALRSWLERGVVSKSWVYHPLQNHP